MNIHKNDYLRVMINYMLTEKEREVPEEANTELFSYKEKAIWISL